jgi:hypothetical protein
MTKAYVFVEGPSDVQFLERLLAPEAAKNVVFVPAGGASYLPSLARSVLVRRRKPVAVFMDSDSVEPEVIEERRENTEELIKAAAGNIPVKVIFAVPEIETLFFSSPEVIERVLGENVPPEFLALGQRDPTGVLRELANRSHRQWDMKVALRSLDAHDLERMRSAPPVRELNNFLLSLPENDRTEKGKPQEGPAPPTKR